MLLLERLLKLANHALLQYVKLVELLLMLRLHGEMIDPHGVVRPLYRLQILVLLIFLFVASFLSHLVTIGCRHLSLVNAPIALLLDLLLDCLRFMLDLVTTL